LIDQALAARNALTEHVPMRRIGYLELAADRFPAAAVNFRSTFAVVAATQVRVQSTHSPHRRQFQPALMIFRRRKIK
jgi:hypothetical protein